MTYNHDIHKRRSIRLRDYDYAEAGAYFVTICTSKKECMFGGIVDGKMVLNGYGHVVQEEWLRTENNRENVELDCYVVMPNHFHAILIITDSCRGTACRALAEYDDNGGDKGMARHAPTCRQFANPIAGSLSTIIGSFKSASTRRINQSRNTPGRPVWQRNYYEHVIRDENELNATRQYIFENPLKWDRDDENINNCRGGSRIARPLNAGVGARRAVPWLNMTITGEIRAWHAMPLHNDPANIGCDESRPYETHWTPHMVSGC